MNIHAIYHETESRYSFPLDKNHLVIRLRTDKNDKLDVSLIYGKKYTYQTIRESINLQVKYTDDLFNYYEIVLKLEDLRLAYIFCIKDDERIYYYSEEGLTTEYDFYNSFYNFFQMPYINEVDVLNKVEWTKDAIFYQIFVDRFNRGIENKEDSYINMKWNDKPTPKSFAGGDIQGITDKIDYLKKIGINTIYLTPIFKSPSNHKYDIIDYYEIDEAFGNKKIFKNLVEKLHNNDMKIVLDAVFNHISIKNKYFKDVIDNGKKSKYFNWFIIKDDTIDIEKVNYETFAEVEYMSKWNTSNIEVQDYLINVGKYWIEEFDIDGWRLDVADEVSHNFWRKFREEIKSIKKDTLILGESWHDANAFLKGDEFDGIMNYSFTKSSLDYFKNRIDAQEMSNRLNHLLMRNYTQVNEMNLNILDSHDTLRFFTEVEKSYDKTLSAYALMMCFQGIPYIYYGSEIFMEGGFDPDSRRGFDWNQDNWNKKYNDLFRKIIQLRREETLKIGDIKIFSEDDILHIRRKKDDDIIELLINLSSSKEIDIEGEIILSNLYEENKLNKNGFIVIKLA